MSDKKAWAGRFEREGGSAMEDFHSSLRFDRRLWREDIEGSRAHAAMLAACGILSSEDARKIDEGLEKVRGEIEAGTFVFDAKDEDIHMAVEKRLTEIVGAVGGRLHTARSRNDQVATDVRLHLTRKIDEQIAALRSWIALLVGEAAKSVDLVLPGTTHLQPAQPVRLAFWFLAYGQMFLRDLERLRDCRKRVNRCPLGSGAFAGVNWPIDRNLTAKTLGFDSVLPNAMDAVADRDFVAEYLSCASLVMVHASRLCEELIVWSNPSFGFVEMDDAYATGSSIMPNKKNPDAAELIRGKSGRVFGDLQAILAVMKGLPLAYNKDLQEDKEALFDGIDTVDSVLSILPGMVSTLRWNPAAMRRACEFGYLQATDLADHLAANGVPFREAHHVVGSLVKRLASEGRTFGDLSDDDFAAAHPAWKDQSKRLLDLENVIEGKRSEGGTSRESVLRQIEDLKRAIA